MKIELLNRKPQEFEPIEIKVVIHSEEEAWAFWHLGNMSESNFREAVKKCTISGHVPFKPCFKPFYHLLEDTLKTSKRF